MLIDQFRSFHFTNYPNDMEMLIEHFSIFGGLGCEIDTSKTTQELIKIHILENYFLLNQKIEYLTLEDNSIKRLLAALAVGDRRMFSAFNRAGVSNAKGGASLHYLEEKGLIWVEYSREKAKEKKPNQKLKKQEARRRISHKVFFVHPFVRFWFYFVHPHTREIQNRDYENFFKRFANRQNSYTSLIFEELSELLLDYHLRDTQIISTGSYWDANMEIDILTITEDGSIYVGECKWTNSLVNKKLVNQIKDKCDKLEIEPTQIILFSKRGFSKELLQNQGKDLALYSAEDFEILLKTDSKYQPTPKFIDVF